MILPNTSSTSRSTKKGLAPPKAARPAERSSRVFPAPGTKPGCATDIKVEYGQNARLPNPWTNWVDMTYRVRGDRNGNGLIEIWANDRFIARVTGSIGRDEVGGPNQYFKFGIYREFTRGSSTAYFDNFARAATREKLEALRRGFDNSMRMVIVPRSQRTIR